MKITIAGAGALGSRFGFALQQAGNDVTLVDGWPAHVNTIRQHGLTVTLNDKSFTTQIPVIYPGDVTDNMNTDLIIVFTKSMQLEQMLQNIQPMITSTTKVLCLLNGIGHEDIIEKYVARQNIFIGNTMWTASLVAPGHTKSFGDGSVSLQNIVTGQESAALDLAACLSEAGLNAKYTSNIHYSIYRKACVNGTMNGLCTLLDADMATVGATRTAHKIVTTIVNEFTAVAKQEGIELDTAEIVSHVEACYNPETIGHHYPSMHQDLIKNHRLTEIDYINGAISRKGQRYGIPTPYCDFLTELIHCKEDILLDNKAVTN